ncbi:L-alanine-DL-glutamate epimerase [Pricia antarctica]|uniref:L-alanine-DL-glutamate epimerase n=1 Tax=Pricia antarctica TaxID=641691 RepID=A0A1G7J1Y0_9FLAO|nr:mandelate racemase/muconate lactonizing enzyme family protein [Pricia antarctica]SDF18930.1 L-alanine-DL-glutamate epimerase [Pricia antarctica]
MKDRRSFIKNSVLGGITLSGMMFSPIEDIVAATTSNVDRSSGPSNLKITDLRYVIVEHLGRPCPILRIDTNQDIHGLGEVRDGGDKKYALLLKKLLLGQNPCNVEMIFKNLKPHGTHGRLGGGVSGVEMALWDLAGKAYGAPVWQLLGGKYRDKVRLYADTHADMDFDLIVKKVKQRVDNEGYTWLKMTRCYRVAEGIPGGYYREGSRRLSQKGIDGIAEYLHTVRRAVGPEIPISADHFGDSSVGNMIRLGNALEPARLAWMEEPVNWRRPDQLKAVSGAIGTPVASGEDIYGRETFQNLCDLHAVDIVHPDMATAGGILETKKIGDYAEDHGIGQALHYAGTPVSFMANVHCAAATQNCAVLEFHPEGDEIPEWTKIVKTIDGQPLITQGSAHVPDSPGLGIELDMEHIKTILHPSDRSIFARTSEWDKQ